MDESKLFDLIGNIYQSALDPGEIPLIARLVQEAMDTESSIHFVSEKRTGKMVHLLSASPNFDVPARRDYALYYHDRNEWFQRAVQLEAPCLMRGEELVDYHEFERTEFCADWCSRVGIYHMIGCTYTIAEGLVGGSGVHKTRKQGPFTDGEKCLYGTIMSHVARALQIAHRLQTIRNSDGLTLEVIEALDVGVMLVSSDCSIVFANRVAANALRHGQWLTASAGKVRPSHRRSSSSFTRRVGVAAGTSAGAGLGTGGVVRLSDRLGRKLPVLIAPFRSRTLCCGPGKPLAALVFHTPSSAMPMNVDAIAQTCGLSAAESRLVASLVAGHTLVESAAQIGISVNTAKTQLRSVFAKTGFARQSDLLGHVLGHPVLRLAGRSPGTHWH